MIDKAGPGARTASVSQRFAPAAAVGGRRT